LPRCSNLCAVVPLYHTTQTGEGRHTATKSGQCGLWTQTTIELPGTGASHRGCWDNPRPRTEASTPSLQQCVQYLLSAAHAEAGTCTVVNSIIRQNRNVTHMAPHLIPADPNHFRGDYPTNICNLDIVVFVLAKLNLLDIRGPDLATFSTATCQPLSAVPGCCGRNAVRQGHASRPQQPDQANGAAWRGVSAAEDVPPGPRNSDHCRLNIPNAKFPMNAFVSMLQPKKLIGTVHICSI
jgi:hypothetical protein